MVEEMMAISEGSPRAVARRPGRKGSREKRRCLHSVAPRVRPSGLSLKVVLPESPDLVGLWGSHSNCTDGGDILKILPLSKHFRCLLGAWPGPWGRGVGGQREEPCAGTTQRTCPGDWEDMAAFRGRGREWEMRPAGLRGP